MRHTVYTPHIQRRPTAALLFQTARIPDIAGSPPSIEASGVLLSNTSLYDLLEAAPYTRALHLLQGVCNQALQLVQGEEGGIMNDDDEEYEDNSSHRGIILTMPETEQIAVLFNNKGYDHVRVVWQGEVAVLWPMRMRPLDYATAD